MRLPSLSLTFLLGLAVLVRADDVLTQAPAVAEDFHTLPDFKVELLFTVPLEQLGTWVAITFDPQGRLIASDQGDKGLCRITPAPLGSDEPTRVERLTANVSGAQGLVCAFGHLYASVNGGRGSGLYRLRDTDNDDQYDAVDLLKAFRGSGEHGPHAVRLAPDGESLVVVCGNHTLPPLNFQSSRVAGPWGEDLLLPRQWDAQGHARGILAPGGWIARTDPDGRKWEIVSIGYRNAYDFAFNADGELFAYDSDMEWDLGTPWYRPTRLVHATSGSEFGWRSGSGKWPAYYLDSLPPAHDVGPGSPVGVSFGYGAKFPAKYQRALFLADWTFGTLHAVHLTPQGASYSATREEFLTRKGLPLTDTAIGPDGALYFTIGGRGTQSELYRVTYVGSESTEPTDLRDEAEATLRSTRRQLEAFHAKQSADDAALETIWSHLGHEDRFLRFAARTALEHQDVARWQDRALAERSPAVLPTALAAFARQGDKRRQADAFRALDRLVLEELAPEQQLDVLRVYQLLFVRQGQPDAATAARIADRLDRLYPSKHDAVNRELCAVLCYLQSPTVITKTLALMKPEAVRREPPGPGAPDVGSPDGSRRAAPDDAKPDNSDLLARNATYGETIAKVLANAPDVQALHLAFCLRTLRFGWTLEQRKQYFAWFAAARERSGGASYLGFLEAIRQEALDNTSPAEKRELDPSTLGPPAKPAELPRPEGPGRAWTLEAVVAGAERGLRARDFERGRRTYAAAKCGVCHRFDGEGGATGPDLTNVAGRFRIRDLTEAIVDPSKVISDQYRATSLTTTAGRVLTGRIVGETERSLTLLVDPQDATKVVEIVKSEIESRAPSSVSLMPKDLLNLLNEQEVLDLLAYLLSRGNPNDPVFSIGPVPE